jgi:hypothetical protein
MVEETGAVDDGAVAGCGSPPGDRARRIAPTRRRTNATMERYQPMAGPQVVVAVTSKNVVELEPKKEFQGPLAGWPPGVSFPNAPGSTAAKSPGAAITRIRATTASMMAGVARRELL